MKQNHQFCHKKKNNSKYGENQQIVFYNYSLPNNITRVLWKGRVDRGYKRKFQV